MKEIPRRTFDEGSSGKITSDFRGKNAILIRKVRVAHADATEKVISTLGTAEAPAVHG